jgi:DNA invertase Pin-like site-specific DNA recombinase
MLVGYARVSTTDQTLDLQHDALTKAGCTKIYTDTASGALTERKGLTEALEYVRPGDTLVVADRKHWRSGSQSSHRPAHIDCNWPGPSGP